MILLNPMIIQKMIKLEMSNNNHHHPVAKPHLILSECGCYMSDSKGLHKKSSVLLNKSHERAAIGRLHFTPFRQRTSPLKILPLFPNPFMLAFTTETQGSPHFEDCLKILYVSRRSDNVKINLPCTEVPEMVEMSNQNGGNSRDLTWHDNGSG